MTDSPRRPFCAGTKALRSAFDAWEARLAKLGVELSEEDRYVIGLAARAEVRLEALGAELRRERDSARRLRLVAVERLAALDVAKSLDLLERTFGASVGAEQEAEAAPLRATGTDGANANVLEFETGASRGLGVTAARIAAVVANAGRRGLTKAAIRSQVQGSRSTFADGLKEAVLAGAVLRTGLGKKSRPFVYSRGDA